VRLQLLSDGKSIEQCAPGATRKLYPAMPAQQAGIERVRDAYESGGWMDGGEIQPVSLPDP
jgi:hypothetical protein